MPLQLRSSDVNLLLISQNNNHDWSAIHILSFHVRVLQFARKKKATLIMCLVAPPNASV